MKCCQSNPSLLLPPVSNFVIKEEINPDGLVEPSEDMRSTRNLDEDLLLFANRQRDMHDLWHTLTNYGRDELGEVCLRLPVRKAQTEALPSSRL